jgi:hypothetical protein
MICRITLLMVIILALISVVPALTPRATPVLAEAGGRFGPTSGYWLVESDGSVASLGDAANYGSATGGVWRPPVVGMAATPDGRGYWLVDSDGGVFAFGDAVLHGSASAAASLGSVVGMAATPDGGGYWLVTSNGKVFAYGDAILHGSAGALGLAGSVVGMAATPDGGGYWLVTSNGEILPGGDATSYGNAVMHRSAAGLGRAGSVVGMAATPDGRGYWLAASNGEVFAFGDATFDGSAYVGLRKPVVGMAATPDGRGYWLAASDGDVFAFGDATRHGSAGGRDRGGSVVGMAMSSPLPLPPAPPTSVMSPPPGYTNQQMIFEDQFAGTTLDATKWTPLLGAQGRIWDDRGHLPWPYSGPNVSGAGTEAAMFGPSQVAVDNGLTLTAQRNTNQYAGTYPWISGVVTTEGKFTLPTSGWYVQVVAKMPDQTQGMWPAIWFLPGTPGTEVNELDGYEGGFIGPAPNDIMHSDYFANQGQQEAAYNIGSSVNTGYNVYGFKFIPGQSITAYFNNRQVWEVSAGKGVSIAGEPYEIMLELQVATEQTQGWHTVTTATTPSATMKVAEVRAYSSQPH